MTKLAAALLGILMLASCATTSSGTKLGQAKLGVGDQPIGKMAPIVKYESASGGTTQISYRANRYTFVMFSSEDNPAESIIRLVKNNPTISFVLIRMAKDDCLRAKPHQTSEQNLTMICDPESLLTKLYGATDGQGYLVNESGEITAKLAADGYDVIARHASKKLAEIIHQEEMAEFGN